MRVSGLNLVRLLLSLPQPEAGGRWQLASPSADPAVTLFALPDVTQALTVPLPPTAQLWQLEVGPGGKECGPAALYASGLGQGQPEATL